MGGGGWVGNQEHSHWIKLSSWVDVGVMDLLEMQRSMNICKTRRKVNLILDPWDV